MVSSTPQVISCLTLPVGAATTTKSPRPFSLDDEQTVEIDAGCAVQAQEVYCTGNPPRTGGVGESATTGDYAIPSWAPRKRPGYVRKQASAITKTRRDGRSRG